MDTTLRTYLTFLTQLRLSHLLVVCEVGAHTITSYIVSAIQVS